MTMTQPRKPSGPGEWAVNTSPEPVSKSPENEQGDGLKTVAHMRLGPSGRSTGVSDIGPECLRSGDAQIIELVTRASAATALEAANRRIAELEGALSEANANGAVHWSRALKAEARLAEWQRTHRWNIEEQDGDLIVCRGDHDKGEKCEPERFVPAARQQGVKP